MAVTFSSGSQSPSSLSQSRTIDRVFEDAQHTGEINLSGRKLKEYPQSVAGKYDLVDTISADLSKNRLQDVPKEVCDYGSMEKLNCYHNVLKSLPDALVQLQALTHLNLSRNQVTMIPTFISQLHQLEVLIASHNRLVSLPEEIGILDKLMEIDVSCNEISHLPNQIGDLKSLRALNVRRNLLVELPIEISKLNLRKLDFSNNKISKIPTVFRKIETLEEICLDNNPLTQPPAHVCTKGKQHIMKFLQIEAIREERKRGVMNEAEIKRLRKSLPPQQSISSEEFRNMMESSENKAWKRHTVLSSDSGYSTTDSIEKCGWSTAETNGDIHMEDASRLSLRAAEVVREQRYVRDLDYRHRLPPHEPKPPPPPPITLPPQSDLPPKSPALTPKTPTPQHNHVYGQVPSPRSPDGYVSSSPQLTPDTPLANQAQGFDDQFSRELQRQKSDYERRKKLAEQLRVQQEEEEKEHRRRAAIRLQEEQRALLDRQRDEMRAQEDTRLEAQRQEDIRKREEEQARTQTEEEARLREEQRQQDEARQRDEQKQDAQQFKVENKKLKPRRSTIDSSLSYGYLHNTWHAPDPQHGYPPSGYSPTGYSPTGYSPTGYTQNSFSPTGYSPPGYSYGNRYDSSPTDTYSMHYGKPTITSQSFKEDRKQTSNIQYRRTASDSTPKHPPTSIPNTTSRTNHVKNFMHSNFSGPSNLRSPSGSSSTTLVSPSPSPRSSIGSAGPSPASSTSSVNKAGEIKQLPGPVARRGKISERVAASTNPTKSTTGLERHGRATTASTTSRQPAMSKTLPTSTSTNSARKNHLTPEEEFRQKHQSLKTSHHQDAQRAKSRIDDSGKLKQTQREAVNNFVSKRQSSTSSDEDKKKILAPRTTYSTMSAKRQGGVMSSSTMKVIDSYKDADPSFTIRRQMEQQREETETMESLRRTIETKLKVTLPDNVQDVLRDGVLLCQLANNIRPRSVTSIHVPSPAVPKLTMAKCRKNVENFLEACRKIGVSRDQICAAQDILEERGISRVAVTISALVAVTTNPRGSNV